MTAVWLALLLTGIPVPDESSEPFNPLPYENEPQPPDDVGETPKPDPEPEPLEPDHPNPHWFPVQGHVAAMGLLGPGTTTTFGANLYLGGAYGFPTTIVRDTTLLGFFLGGGVTSFLGSTDLVSDCPGSRRCAARQSIGGAIRGGIATFNRDHKRVGAVLWPDIYSWLQVEGFTGIESVPSQPLAPGLSNSLSGFRVSVGVNAVGWSGWIISNMSNSDNNVLTSILWVPLVLLNHFELNVEWSRPGLSPGGVRFGLSIGTGF